MNKVTKWYTKGYIQEIIFFIGMFILTMLHEWIQVDTVMGLIKGLVFFLVLYMQAQIHRFFFFPLFLRKMYGTYVTTTVLSTLLWAQLIYALNYHWVEPELYRHLNVVLSVAYHFVICLISTMTILSFFLVRQYSITLQKRNEDQKLLSEMNMKFLHAQLNPHFFFNMFNNLYGVSLTEPARVPDLILKLSGLMRYQLENGSKTSVRLNDEVGFIQSYIAMEKERVGKRCDILFEHPGEKDTLAGYEIAPLLLITLVENAFKHSVTIVNRWYIYIKIAVDDDVLYFYIYNSLGDESLKTESTSIGLVNVRQRLELFYKGLYNFETSPYGKEYRTYLSVRLNSL